MGRLTAFAGKSVIEIKVGDNGYSVRALEEALENQLIGLYLINDECTSGILLVTYAGGKKFNDTATGKEMPFEEVINHLEEYAAKLQRAAGRSIFVSVVGIDLRDAKKVVGKKSRALESL